MNRLRRLIAATGVVVALVAALVTGPLTGESADQARVDFGDGVREVERKNWAGAADLMTKALENRRADGELIRIYGRWFEPYLPHYHLGQALYELGCYEAALHHLESSVIRDRKVRGGRAKLETLESLREKSAEYLRLGIRQKTGSSCDRWWSSAPAPPDDGAATDDPILPQHNPESDSRSERKPAEKPS